MAEGKSISLEEIKKENVDLVSLCLYSLHKTSSMQGSLFIRNKRDRMGAKPLI